MARIETGSWRALDAAELNTAALALGPDQNVLSSGEPAAPQFMDFMPPDFLRPHDVRDVARGQ